MRKPATNQRLFLAAVTAVLAVITWADFATGYELGFFVFYFIPVSLAAWYGGRRLGLVFAFASAACGYLSDHLAGDPHVRTLYEVWETLMRLVAYSIMALALARIRAAIRHQRDLLRVVSHDLRAPLTAIAGQAQLLVARGEPGSWAASRGQSIVRAAMRMASMIEDLVDGARLESRRLRLDLQAVELHQFLGELFERMAASLPCDRVDLRIPGERVAVRADPARLERIVLNLLSNALRYSPEDARVEVEVEPAGSRVVISVVDHGPGIAAEDRAHLFERYYRGAASAGTDGIGLGLHSTRLLVRAHGGRIRVEGEVGAGAAFRVELPRALAGSPPARPPG